jgi:hypothetical protein
MQLGRTAFGPAGCIRRLHLRCLQRCFLRRAKWLATTVPTRQILVRESRATWLAGAR